MPAGREMSSCGMASSALCGRTCSAELGGSAKGLLDPSCWPGSHCFFSLACEEVMLGMPEGWAGMSCLRVLRGVGVEVAPAWLCCFALAASSSLPRSSRSVLAYCCVTCFAGFAACSALTGTPAGKKASGMSRGVSSDMGHTFLSSLNEASKSPVEPARGQWLQTVPQESKGGPT